MPPPSMARMRMPRPFRLGRPTARHSSSFSPRIANARIAAMLTRFFRPSTCRKHPVHSVKPSSIRASCAAMKDVQSEYADLPHPALAAATGCWADWAYCYISRPDIQGLTHLRKGKVALEAC